MCEYGGDTCFIHLEAQTLVRKQSGFKAAFIRSQSLFSNNNIRFRCLFVMLKQILWRFNHNYVEHNIFINDFPLPCRRVRFQSRQVIRAMGQPEWGRRGHVPPRNKLAKIFTGVLYEFSTVRKTSAIDDIIHWPLPNNVPGCVTESESDLSIVSKCLKGHLMLISTLSYRQFEISQMQWEESTEKSNKLSVNTVQKCYRSCIS